MIIKTTKGEYNFEFIGTLIISKRANLQSYKDKVNEYKKRYHKLVKSLEKFNIKDAKKIEGGILCVQQQLIKQRIFTLDVH